MAKQCQTIYLQKGEGEARRGRPSGEGDGGTVLKEVLGGGERHLQRAVAQEGLFTFSCLFTFSYLLTFSRFTVCLLYFQVGARLGCASGRNGAKEVMCNAWFNDINWRRLKAGELVSREVWLLFRFWLRRAPFPLRCLVQINSETEGRSSSGS